MEKLTTMQVMKAKFIERVRRTPTVESFRFACKEPCTFLPGQFLKVIFDETASNNKLNKYLSFSCAPGKDYIEVTKRVSDSDFSRCLTNLAAGDAVLLQMPMGNCIYRPEYKRIVFLIGGIGVTPAVSIIEYIMRQKLDTGVSLLYANRSEEEIAFKPELDFWRQQNKNIDIYYLVGKKNCVDSDCREGSINEAFCRDTVKDILQSKVFIYGPPAMVEAMKEMALKLGCSKENILSENFIGY